MYYDRQGQPMTLHEWGQAFEQPRSLANTMLRGPARGSKWVSTVWLGLDHRFDGDGPPLIFETMVFRSGSMVELDVRRYATEDEARAGHAALCKIWKHNRAARRGNR